MAPTQRLNVIVIICDDLACGDLHCHGNPFTITPTWTGFIRKVLGANVTIVGHSVHLHGLAL